MKIRHFLLLGAGATLVSIEMAQAQQALPAIVVNAASPIRHRPAIQVAAPARPAVAAPRPRQTAAPLVARPAPVEAPPAPDWGTAPVVAGEFASVTVIPREELRRGPGATLGDLLFAKPGITGSSFAPGAASRPVVRGLDNYRVRIQENGVGASGASEQGEDHAVPLDPVAMDQIEVVRGPATLRWGSQAIGGVVNASNNRIPDALPCRAGEDSAKGCARFETRSGVSSVDNGLDSAVMLDAGRGAIAVHADAFGRRASDYRIPAYPYLAPPDPPPFVAGLQPNSSNRSGGASLGGSYVFENGFVGFAVTQNNSRYHIPGLEPTDARTRIMLRQTRVTARGELRPQGSIVEAVRFWAGLTDYKHHEMADENGFDGVQQTYTNKEVEGRAELQFAPVELPFATLTSVVGAQASHQILASPGREGGVYDPNRTKSVAAFSFNEFRLSGALRAQLAGRIEHVAVHGSSPDMLIDPGVALRRDRLFAPKSGAAGVLYDLPASVVGSLTAQYVERAPRAPELLSRGIHEATGTFDVGDPNLGIEAAKSLEVGLRRAEGRLRFEATAYITRFNGFIYRRLTGETCEADFASCTPLGAGGDLKQAFYAQRDAMFRGAEISGQLDLAPLPMLGGMLGAEGQFDIVRASFLSGGDVPRIPPMRLGGGFVWRDAQWLARVNFLHAYAQRRIDPFAETPTPGYNLLRAEIAYRTKISPAGGEMTLGLRGDNLLNERIRNHVSYRKDEVLMPGAGLRLFANMAF